ncbi:MAG TPA: hypothetical protein VFR14_07120 [Candidatus Limnocylindrales bacterium]|nr:hypothetical protein [Candidatus Limnocylindrales bacterium]
MKRVRLTFVGLAVGLALIAPVAAGVAFPDAPPPTGLRVPVPEFGRVLTAQLERPPGTIARFVGHQGRDRDLLVILLFELRAYPYVAPPELAYLVSRCTAMGELDPRGMGGGVIPGGDWRTDPELQYLALDAQPSCQSVR